MFETVVFQNKFTLWQIKLKIIWKTKFTSLKQFLFGLLFFINTKETDTDQNILQLFNSVKKEISHKLSKAAAAKKFFQVAIVLVQIA